jgi:SWI/SNF-related matrix-associated actin-dependent regulator of chromatin subfamily A3
MLQRVVETQERKRELAELLLSPEQHGEAEHGIDRLKVS